MKFYQRDDIRNLAIVGGVGAGKTILSEAMLFNGKIINRLGNISDHNTVSDNKIIEKEKEYSVVSSVLYTEYKGKKINFIDTPGTPDYVGEVVSAVNVADSALLVVSGSEGVDVGAETSWNNAAKDDCPVAIAMNQMDHEKASFENTLASLKENFGSKATAVQYPVNEGAEFDSVIDLMLMKMLKFPKDGGEAEVLDIPDSEADKVEELHLELVEAAAEGSDELMEKYFETETLTLDELREGIRLGMRKRAIFPVFLTSAKHNIGVTRLMEFITTSTPTPAASRKQNADGELMEIDSSKPLSLFVFKTSIEEHLGEVSYFKILNGELNEGMDVYNADTGNKERITQIMVTAGKHKEKVEKLTAGDIAAAVKLKAVSTNTTLNSQDASGVKVQPIVYPEPIFSVAIKAENSSDDEKVGTVLNEMKKMDPSLHANHSKELKQLILSGMGEQHINNVKWIFKNQHKIDVEFASPKIPYRETITKSAKADYRHKKQSGGSGQFGEVHLMIQPYKEGYKDPSDLSVRDTEEHEMEWGGKLIFNNCIVGGAIDKRFMPAIMKGLMERMVEGPLTGSYARDIVVYIYDGKMHPVDSNEVSFKLAGRNAFSTAFKNAAPKIMEPVYNVEVLVPEDLMGNVMTDLQGRRAIIMGMGAKGNKQQIKAQVPLAEMDRYSTALSSLTSGRGTFSMKFDSYKQVPGDVQNELLKKYEEEQAEKED